MAIRFATDVPQTLIFPFGDFREVEGQHGPQFLYTVQLDGNPRDKLYATPPLHREMQAVGVAAGTLLTITKLDGSNRKYWRVENGAPERTDNGPSHEPAQTAVSAPSADHPPLNGRATNGAPDFTSLEHLLGHCVAASSRVCRSLNGEVRFAAEDVRCLGISLFIECSRKGVLPEPLR